MTNILTEMIATVKSPAILLLKVKISFIKEINDHQEQFKHFWFRFSCIYGGQGEIAQQVQQPRFFDAPVKKYPQVKERLSKTK